MGPEGKWTAARPAKRAAAGNEVIPTVVRRCVETHLALRAGFVPTAANGRRMKTHNWSDPGCCFASNGKATKGNSCALAGFAPRRVLETLSPCVSTLRRGFCNPKRGESAVTGVTVRCDACTLVGRQGSATDAPPYKRGCAAQEARDQPTMVMARSRNMAPRLTALRRRPRPRSARRVSALAQRTTRTKRTASQASPAGRPG